MEALKAANWHFWLRIDPSWESTVRLIRNFQTVSEEDFSEVGMQDHVWELLLTDRKPIKEGDR